ncbi:MAG: serine/threonine-protein phosphatase [Bacteroidia bacterium]
MIKKIELFGTTDVGQVRDHNEDNFAICKDLERKEWAFKRDEVLDLSKRGSLLVVADGMGGTNAGEVASHIAQETIQKLFDNLESIPKSASEREKALKRFIVDAHNAIVEHQHKNLDTAGMGTTLVLAWVFEDSVHVAWSGDSRVYLYQGQQEMYPFTDDHSLVWQMVQEGQMTPEEARVHPESNIITQSLGDERQTPKPSAKSKKLYSGDRVMVCSDGLCGMLSDQEIMNFMRIESSTAEICKELVNAANRAGGTDNITVLMLEVKEGDKRPASVINAPIPKPKAPKSQPTTTQVLRKKNSNKNIIIFALVAVIAAFAIWALIPGEEPMAETKIKPVDFEFIKGEKAKINLAQLLLDQSELTFDSVFVQYGKEKLKSKNGKVTFSPDTLNPGKLTVRLYPKGGTSFYSSEIKLHEKAQEEKEMEETPAATPSAPNNSEVINEAGENEEPAEASESPVGETEEPGTPNENGPPLNEEELEPNEEIPVPLTPIRRNEEETETGEKEVKPSETESPKEGEKENEENNTEEGGGKSKS